MELILVVARNGIARGSLVVNLCTFFTYFCRVVYTSQATLAHGALFRHDLPSFWKHRSSSLPVQTINLLRAFASGGYADINKLHAWNMDFVRNTAEGSKYREMAGKIEDTLRFMKVLRPLAVFLSFLLFCSLHARERSLQKHDQDGLFHVGRGSMSNKWGCRMFRKPISRSAYIYCIVDSDNAGCGGGALLLFRSHQDQHMTRHTCMHLARGVTKGFQINR